MDPSPLKISSNKYYWSHLRIKLVNSMADTITRTIRRPSAVPAANTVAEEVVNLETPIAE